jgi:hypothetical protein
MFVQSAYVAFNNIKIQKGAKVFMLNTIQDKIRRFEKALSCFGIKTNIYIHKYKYMCAMCVFIRTYIYIYKYNRFFRCRYENAQYQIE